MIPREDFPRLTDENHRVTSPESADYNCIAWAADDTENWWQPGVFWPTAASQDDYGVAALIQAYQSLGFVLCDDGRPEIGMQKVAIYGIKAFYTHAARQLSTGNWTSKLGRTEDIEHHTPEAVAGGIYGEIVQFMKKPITSQPP